MYSRLSTRPLLLLIVVLFGFPGLVRGQILSLVHDAKYAHPESHEWDRSSNPSSLTVIDDSLYLRTGWLSPEQLSRLEDGGLVVIDDNNSRVNPIAVELGEQVFSLGEYSDYGSYLDLFRYDGDTSTNVSNRRFTNHETATLTALDDAIYFAATTDNNGSHHLGIWKYDGVETTYLDQYGRGAWDGRTRPKFFPLGDSLYYTARNEVGGMSLWRVNNDSVEVVEEFGYEGANVAILGTLGSELLVRSEFKLWGTDGETTRRVGESQIFDIETSPEYQVEHDGWLYFLGDKAYRSSMTLWRTDGTTLEAEFEIGPDSGPGWIYDPTMLGDTLFFDDCGGTEQRGIWKYEPGLDPTLVFEFPNSSEARAPHLTAFDGHVYFGAPDDDGQNQWWRTDGTTVELMADVIPGMPTPHGVDGIVFNGEFYFNGSTPETGAELWKLSPVPEPSTVLLAVVGLGLLALRRRFAVGV